MIRDRLPLEWRRSLAMMRSRVRLMLASVTAPQFARLSYSQYGEDIVACGTHRLPRIGTYLDIGAADPRAFSNTYFFYRQGWSGLNIEPNPAFVEKLRHFRPRDISICAGIGQDHSRVDYFMFNDPILNTFSEEMADAHARRPGVRLIQTMTTEIWPLRDILDQHFPKRNIDLMDVDVEGWNLDVLMSNEWSKWKPCLILVEEFGLAEEIGNDMREICAGNITGFLEERNYRLVARAGPTSVYTTKGDRTLPSAKLLPGCGLAEASGLCPRRKG